MALLLVSVANAPEARLAIQAGADWIDLKNPAAGSLGRAEPHCIAKVLAEVRGRRPVSVALGELADWQHPEQLEQLPLAGVERVKVGLAGTARGGAWTPSWQRRWRQLWNGLPEGSQPVAVHYADYLSCDAPSFDQLLTVAQQADCNAVLVDTFHKQGRSLLDYYPPRQLTTLARQAHELGMLFVAAGSLRREQFAAVADAGADLLAVRGAACEQSQRIASLCPCRITELRQTLDQLPTAES